MSLHKLNTIYSEHMFSITDYIQANSMINNETTKLDKCAKINPPIEVITKDNVHQNTEKNKHCIFNHFKSIIEQNKMLLDNTMDKSGRRLPKRISKQISNRILFAQDVVEERSPHTIPYSQCNTNEIYHKTKIFRSKPLRSLSTPQLYHTKVKPPLHLNTMSKDMAEKGMEKKWSSESFLFGLYDSSEKLKPLNQKSKVGPLTHSSNKDINFKNSPAWEEYVLSKLSKTTADLILKDITPANQAEKLRNFLNLQENKESENLHKINKFENVEESEKNITPQSLYDNKRDSDILYFENIVGKPENVDAEKSIQAAYPYSPSKWLKSDKYKGERNKTGRVRRGMQKWTGYPTFKEEELTMQQISDTKLCDKPINRLRGITKRKDDINLLPVVNEWRNKWLFEKKWQQKPLKDLFEGMKDINDHIKFAAVSAIGDAILEQREAGNTEKEEITDDNFEEIVINDIVRLLDDTSPNVSLAAAVTLFTVNRAVTKATDLLMKTLKEGLPSERWIAIQCLVAYQYHDDCIIKELITYLNSGDVVKHEKAAQMLIKLSELTVSIQYMIGEKLNSASWRDRVVACQILPTLNGKLSKDIANKLSYLIWNDWSAEVRKSAAVALGKSGNGKLVHSTLCERLLSGHCSKQISALKKISSLGIMTEHILLPLLSCFESDNDAVCLQAIKTCTKIKVKDERILDALLALVSSDRPCKLRVYTLRALGCIGCRSPLIRDKLLWTLHFNTEPLLRKEACSSITKLGLKDEEIINVLQDLVIIDEDVSVRCEVVIALYSMGLEAVGDIALTETIQKSVKQLCHKDNVIAYVLAEKDGKLEESLSSKKTSQQLQVPVKNSSDDADTCNQCGDNYDGNNNGNHDWDDRDNLVDDYYNRLHRKEKDSDSSLFLPFDPT